MSADDTIHAGFPTFSAHAVGEYRWPHDAGIGLQAAREPRRLPPDAPNILIVLIDDAGPGLPSTLGGEVHTPTMDRIAMGGISLNRFHTTAMCSPTRASILTGRNHHRVGSGQIAELANDWDGYSGHIPKSSALAAEVLKDYGYSTGCVGKVAQHTRRGNDRRRPLR